METLLDFQQTLAIPRVNIVLINDLSVGTISDHQLYLLKLFTDHEARMKSKPCRDFYFF